MHIQQIQPDVRGQRKLAPFKAHAKLQSWLQSSSLDKQNSKPETSS